MGSPFSYHSQVNPAVQQSTWDCYASPILRSGLSSQVLQPQSISMKSMETFQRKMLRGFLSFSSRSPIPALHFLLGELPIAGQLHRDCLSLFWSIWRNPGTLCYKVVKYLLLHAPDNSRTWASHIRSITKMYGLPDPLNLLQNSPPSKSSWKGTCDSLIYSYYEKQLRAKSDRNSRMGRMNVQLLSLHSSHPLLQNITHPREVQKLKSQLKVLSGDFYTKSVIGERNGTSQHCILCGNENEIEDDVHVFAPNGCPQLADPKERIINEMKETAAKCNPPIAVSSDGDTFTQFVCEPSSYNLRRENRVNLNNREECDILFKLSRDYVSAAPSSV